MATKYTAEGYRSANLEHIKLAEDLHNDQRYVMSHYLAGLAVECMLRAYRWRRIEEFDGRHNIDRLFEDSGYIRVVPKIRAQEFGRYRTELKLRWSNNYRYLSSSSLRRRLRELKLQRGVEGDSLEGSSLNLLKAAIQLVQLGDLKWRT